MLRAVAKGSLLAAFGHAGAAGLYRRLTRKHMHTARTHVDKLARVWPGYVRVWTELAGAELEGAHLWIHEAGATCYSPLAGYLLTGQAVVVSNSEDMLLDQYLSRSVSAVLASDFGRSTRAARRERIDSLRWEGSAVDAVASLGGRVLDNVTPAKIALDDESIDLCHSGGALEHYTPDALDHFLRESYRILKPGKLVSHVLDHRDHLHHADRGLPFLSHLAFSDSVYRALFGHALGYHNRLSPAQVANHFESAGFERVAIRRMILPSRQYVADKKVLCGEPGILRSRLAARFAHFSDDDLRTAAAHYLYRKP